MDNGLIFPYPRGRARAEAGDAKHLNLAGLSGLAGGSCGPDW